jgi:hypothetical protein
MIPKSEIEYEDMPTSACTLSDRSDLVRVTAKASNVLTQPLERSTLIQDASVGRCT